LALNLWGRGKRKKEERKGEESRTGEEGKLRSQNPLNLNREKEGGGKERRDLEGSARIALLLGSKRKKGGRNSRLLTAPYRFFKGRKKRGRKNTHLYE